MWLRILLGCKPMNIVEFY